MIERIGNLRTLCCDECDEEFEPFDKDDFMTMTSAAKGDGWEIRPASGEWIHKCPSCAGSNESPLARARRMLG